MGSTQGIADIAVMGKIKPINHKGHEGTQRQTLTTDQHR
jgi:hypothetical protein